MRADAKSLLAKIGQSDFRYREFADRFAEIEPWPIFEAVLADARFAPVMAQATDGGVHVVPAPAPQAAQARAVMADVDLAAAAVQPAAGQPGAPPHVISPFQRYGTVDPEPGLRAVLRRMSGQIDGGEA